MQESELEEEIDQIEDKLGDIDPDTEEWSEATARLDVLTEFFERYFGAGSRPVNIDPRVTTGRDNGNIEIKDGLKKVVLEFPTEDDALQFAEGISTGFGSDSVPQERVASDIPEA